MNWAEFRGYKIAVRHMIMAVLVVLLIISNIIDEIIVRYWETSWQDRKIITTAFVIMGALVICPVIYRKYFTYEEADKTGE